MGTVFRCWTQIGHSQSHCGGVATSTQIQLEWVETQKSMCANVPSLTQIWILAVGDLEQQYVAAREAQRSIPGLVKNCMLNPLTPEPMTKLMPTCDVPSHPSHVSCDGRSLVWKSGTAKKHEHCLLPAPVLRCVRLVVSVPWHVEST